jgi:hypothetical protein
MKITHFAVASFISNLFTFNVFGQNLPQLGLQLGFNAGTTKYTTEPNHYGTLTTGYQTGFAVGLISNLSLSGHWSLSPGLRYVHSGFKTDEVVPYTDPGSKSSTHFKSTFALNRIELPVDLLCFFDQSRKGLFLTAGASVGMLLGGKRTVDVTTNDGTSSVPFYSIKDDIKVAKIYPLGATAYYSQRWEAGIEAGFGYKYNSIAVQAFYRLGVANIATNSAVGFPSPSIYSRLAELQVSYLFNK